MYWFGSDIGNEWMDEAAWRGLEDKRLAFAHTSLDAILETLGKIGEAWRTDASLIENAVPKLQIESGFTEDEIRSTLKLIPELLNRQSLERRLRAEFLNPEVLNGFLKLPGSQGKMKAIPRGPLLHVTAGNVFLSSIDSLVMGFLTKNISILKVSSQNTFFPLYFAQTLKELDSKLVLANKFSVLHWKGGDSQAEDFIVSKVKTILAWGGEEMLQSYRSRLSTNVKLLDFGPKISFQLITKDGLAKKDVSKVAQKIVEDIIPWNQSACSSPQNLYLQEGIEKDFIEALDRAFLNAPNRAPLSDDQAVEILKETYRGYYSELMQEGKVIVGKTHLLHLEANKYLRPSPLHRSLIIKTFKDTDDLYQHLTPFSFYLQSCSYLLSESEQDAYLSGLALAGVKRFASLGTVTFGMDGAPHDGRLVLRELVEFISLEERTQDYGQEINEFANARSIKEAFDKTQHPEGYIFSSGGTTGEPKFVHFSYEEFDYMTDMLATNFKAQGLKRGMTVANLFVAGNLWSSFMAVEKALEKIGAIQLPIGGLCSQENIVMYLKKFRPQVILGIPSMLVMTAEYCASSGIDLEIDRVFYAGEAMSEMRMAYLQNKWKVKYFGSAGYASVDAGVIGYQCSESKPGEHHLFSELIDLQIVNGEGIVTSLQRKSLPVRNYRTGDRMEWISDCSCGRKDPRFKLMGRIDDLIQIWSCRIQLSDIEKSIRELNPHILSYQLIPTQSLEGNRVSEILNLYLEGVVNPVDLLDAIYRNSRDLKDTISFEEFSQQMRIHQVGAGQIKRNERTGKISLLIDQRH